MGAVHTYRCELRWAGSTAAGYGNYSRSHHVRTPPAKAAIVLSGDAAFHGDARLQNPEQLLLAAAASCQLLSFLAVAARARIDVIAYEDEASGFMPEDDPPVRITRIELRPRITVAGRADPERVRHYVELAHRECFIANSLRSEIVLLPEIEIRDE
jgi:organic hydroperoxide reductase OsmC/OhrA